MFGKHAAYIIPSYAITAFVIAALVVWIIDDLSQTQERDFGS